MLKISEKLMVRASDPDEIYSLSDEELDRAAAAEIDRLTAENERLRAALANFIGLPSEVAMEVGCALGNMSAIDQAISAYQQQGTSQAASAVTGPPI